MKLRLVAVNYRAIGKNTLKGSFDLITPAGMRFLGVMWHQGNGREWVAMPAIPYDDDGARKWRNIFEWETPEAKEAFQMAALEALYTLLDRAGSQNDRAGY